MGKPQIGIKGFSLAEMMVVISVFGLLLALSIPAISGYIRSSRLAGAVNELVGDIQYTRALAASERRTFQIAFSASDYAIFEVVAGDTVRTRAMPQGMGCTASANPNFYAWGLADPVTITLDSGSRSIDVNLAANGSVTHY